MVVLVRHADAPRRSRAWATRTALDAPRSHADAVQDNVPPSYAIYMFDPAPQTWLIVAAPPSGFMYTDPVALQARTEPQRDRADRRRPGAGGAGPGADRSAQRLRHRRPATHGRSACWRRSTCRPAARVGIAQTTPTDPLDTRAQVADLARMKDPADAAYGARRRASCAPPARWRRRRARWACAARSARPTSSSSRSSATRRSSPTARSSCRCRPTRRWRCRSSTPRAARIQTHLNWIQVRPGERRTCDGCHSPRRGGALNSGAVVNTMPAGAARRHCRAAHQSGETMASTAHAAATADRRSTAA